MIRMISERAIQVQKDVYLCFIHYANSFDKVRHKELMELLGNFDIFRKDARIIENLYWEKTTCIELENEFSKYTKTERGIR